MAAHGKMYASDGYGQFRVHRFGSDGKLKQCWGEQGTGPGQFALPHDSIWADSRGDVYVSEVVQPNNIQKYTRRR